MLRGLGLFEAPAAGAGPGAGHADALSLSFNQDGSRLAIGTRDGFRVYGLQPFARHFVSRAGGQRLAEVMGWSNLVCLVGAGEAPALSPRCLRLYDLHARKVLTEVSFAAAVTRVVLNRSRLAAACPGAVYVFDLSTMECLRALDLAAEAAADASTPDAGATAAAAAAAAALSWPGASAPSNLMELSSETAAQPCLLATLTTFTGEVLLFDTLRLRTVHKFIAHKSALDCLAFSGDGRKLCTASVTGTVIRVFSVPEGGLQAQLRRGLQPATIFALSFSPTGNFLSCASSSGTIHIFDLTVQVSKDEMHRAAVQVHPLVPSGVRTLCRITSEEEAEDHGGAKLTLRVVSYAGVFFEYEVERRRDGSWTSRQTSENSFADEDEEGEATTTTDGTLEAALAAGVEEISLGQS